MTEAARVLALLAERGQTLAVAESLTGGLVAAELTGVPGASASFRGSVTAYATALKHELLGVDAALLAERGAVDPEVASQMAAGVRARLGADWGIATTGVAGPEPQDGQPVGTVYVAVAGPAGETARTGTPGFPEGALAGSSEGPPARSAGESPEVPPTRPAEESPGGSSTRPAEESPGGSSTRSPEVVPVGKVVPLRLNGDRGEIRRESVRIVLELLREELSGNVRAQDTEQNGGNGCLQP
ncbi:MULTISPECIES: nicotinamide-nucleotide amidohydrolase family protein [unclassified Streptomyces]|uniref:nicotinamide-nucleotide amidohydrolase family protein n=1 Tax=unclassified Streptomyces TaxID=2593676 RepID=UPI0035D83DF9